MATDRQIEALVMKEIGYGIHVRFSGEIKGVAANASLVGLENRLYRDRYLNRDGLTHVGIEAIEDRIEWIEKKLRYPDDFKLLMKRLDENRKRLRDAEQARVDAERQRQLEAANRDRERRDKIGPRISEICLELGLAIHSEETATTLEFPLDHENPHDRERLAHLWDAIVNADAAL